MKKALIKDTFREIKGSFGRFFAILAIVFLGVAFYAGITATGPDMRITGDNYFDDTHFMDIRLLSTFGFSDKDIAAIEKVEEVDGVFPTYSMDVLVTLEDKEEVIKVFSLPLDKLNNQDESYINRPTLVEGRFPEASNEIVVERGALFESGFEIGSGITLASGTDEDISESLKETEYKIVGIVEHPYYISYERGTSSIGNGRVSAFVMIPQENFKSEFYTEVYVTSKAARAMGTYDDEYEELIDNIKDSLEAVAEEREEGRYNEIIAEAQAELEEGRQELQEGEETLNKELADAENKLKDAERELQEGRNTLNQERVNFNNQIKDAERQIAAGYQELEAGEAEYNQGYNEFQAQKTQIEAQLQEGENALKQQEDQYSQQQALLASTKEQLADESLTPEKRAELMTRVAELELVLPMMRQGLDEAWQDFNSQKQQAEAGFAQGEADLAAARSELDSGRAELKKQEANLQAGKAEAERGFLAAEREIQQGEEEIAEGWREYEKGKEEGIAELQKGRDEIAEAEEEIASIEKPEWYVLGRDTNYGYMQYGAAAENMDAIARVFPVFFFLIAALVALTTMTRMVDEQRINVGTYKALGYSKGDVAFKYIVYAILASSLGAILGVLLGFELIPRIVFNAFSIMYTLPNFDPAFHVGIAIGSVAIAVSVTVFSTVFACIKELTANPSILMRPKAPRTGKRIFLERITFIWSRISFIQKVTFRNIFRYKKRFFMTVIGIGGCTALILVGFGVKDSIRDIVGKQYNEIFNYNASIDTDISLKEARGEEILDFIEEEKKIESFIVMDYKNIQLASEDGEEDVILTTPERPEDIYEFISLRQRTNGKEVKLSEKGVILTEKLANVLEVDIGDNVAIKEDNREIGKVQVTGITENYSGHSAYITPELYQEIYKSAPEYKSILIKATDSSEKFEDELSNTLLEEDNITSVTFVTSMSETFDNMITSLNYVVIVLIISAGALAFIVLYNLTNINVSERLREIATIKVLGFYDKEVSAYVYRENLVLSIVGTLFGLVLGAVLHQFVIVTAEMDDMMFGREIMPMSYVYAAVLTMVFAVVVNYVMFYKLKRIKMVESLKSVD
ncbi:FtsX-like permease family protein [Alloiococcus sp. CFN-8]|uniref:FtsX-like permease family protein n=1 Tax=Alloiococcus sp. CFN-8 TaxID=3416081 RepID=UPI003CEFAD15